MTHLASEAPDESLDRNDPGDDVQRRFRYQAAYAGLMSLGMLHEDTEVTEVFCEQKEDILVKHPDSTFTGIQVKTRKSGQEPFKATDRQTNTALLRYVSLDQQHPEHFRSFVLVSNCGFWAAEKNRRNLPYLLGLAQSATPDSFADHSHLSKWITKLASDGGTRPKEVLQTLKKVRLQQWASLEDYELKLVGTLGALETHETWTHARLTMVVRNLIARMMEAAALVHTSPLEQYLSLSEHPQELYFDQIIQGKRITKAIVNEIVSIPPNDALLLASAGGVDLQRLPKGVGTLVLKMEQGDIRVGNVNLAKDQKHSMELLLAHWLHKYGVEKAKKLYDDLHVVVDTECQEAYDDEYSSREPFGSRMLANVRKRLRQRHEQQRSRLHNCEYEQLLGLASILTEECKVWWSIPFELPEELKP